MVSGDQQEPAAFQIKAELGGRGSRSTDGAPHSHLEVREGHPTAGLGHGGNQRVLPSLSGGGNGWARARVFREKGSGLLNKDKMGDGSVRLDVGNGLMQKSWMCLRPGVCTFFSVKGQVANALGFSGHLVTVATPQLSR